MNALVSGLKRCSQKLLLESVIHVSIIYIVIITIIIIIIVIMWSVSEKNLGPLPAFSLKINEQIETYKNIKP